MMCVILAGGSATDEEGESSLGFRSRPNDPDVLICLPRCPGSPQRAATIFKILGKVRLTVAKPVEGQAGYRRLYRRNPFNSYMVGVGHSKGAALRIHSLLDNPDLMAQVGRDAKEYVRQNFLITRNLGDYLALMNYLG
jgi:trehalose synthase